MLRTLWLPDFDSLGENVMFDLKAKLPFADADIGQWKSAGRYVYNL